MAQSTETVPKAAPYTKWTAIAGTVVAALSLTLNAFLGISNLRLSEIVLLVKQQEANVDLEAQYLVVSGSALREVEHIDLGNSGRQSDIESNQVMNDLSEMWTEGWTTGSISPLVGEGGHTRSHGVLFYRLANRGKQNA